MTEDAESLILGSDVVIELIGGIEPARSWIKLALESGADVVTANKALIAAHGPELFGLADQLGAQLYFEAAVAGAIPIIRPLRESLAGDKINRVMGIVNGTTNFILDRMESTGAEFGDALELAKKLGYAEADPTADIEGFDAQSKASIIASSGFSLRGSGRVRLSRGNNKDHCAADKRCSHSRLRGEAFGDLRTRLEW